MPPDYDLSLGRELKDFFNTSEAYADHLTADNEAYFARYLDRIRRYAPNARRVLDLGCGKGLSSDLISRLGKTVTGCDISELFLSHRKACFSEDLSFTAGDAMNLPFRDCSFDLVCSYLVIEFFPDVRQGLEEMIRVLKPGGILLIMAPNLLSPRWPLRDLFNMLTSGKKRPVWGESLSMVLKTFLRNTVMTLYKCICPGYHFEYRRPDLTCQKVVGSDSDSVYYACPVDLVRYLRAHRFKILRTGAGASCLDRLFPSFSVAVEVIGEKHE